MTWVVDDRNGQIAVKTHGMGDDDVFITQGEDHLVVSMKTLCETMLYVLTNSNIDIEDVRPAFIETIKEIKRIPGYSDMLTGNTNLQRLGVVPDKPELLADKMAGGTGKAVQRFFELLGPEPEPEDGKD